MKIAFVFPGQGSQNVGMGKDLYENFSEVKDIYNEASDAFSPYSYKDIFFPFSSIRTKVTLVEKIRSFLSLLLPLNTLMK